MQFIGAVLSIVVLFCIVAHVAGAADIRNYSDTLTDSAPSEYSNHTLRFITKVPIPTGGYIRFRPSPGDFTIPTTNFGLRNVALYVGDVLRNTGTTTSTSTDGVSITTGTNGAIEITLNTLTGIAADAEILLRIGSSTVHATSSDLGILNPSSIGTYPIHIETGGGTTSESVRALVAIVHNVQVPNVDTTETVPPHRFNGAPSGELSGTSLIVQVSLETDEFALCRYSTASGTPYFSMTNQFTTNFVTVHTFDLEVATSTVYDLYVRCIDDEGNFNTDDYLISFSIPEYPEGEPGTEGDSDGDGDADPGDGSPDGDTDSDNSDTGDGSSSSGGGGGGGDDGGGFEGTEKPYQSGDGRVIINGYAFPDSDVTILVDGTVIETDDADGTGKFSVTVDEIARGVYTFGVYATDANGIKSSTFSTTFSVTGSRGSTLSNVNVMPSVQVTPDPVDPGATVQFSGYAIPNATITIENQSDKSSVTLKTFTTTSDGDGAWSYDASTAGFQTGTYKVRAKAKQESGVSTDYADWTFYGVGEEADTPRASDLNRDGSVNLIDFSILLFWWGTDGGESNPPADINADGRVSLTDFSIMIFNWTG